MYFCIFVFNFHKKNWIHKRSTKKKLDLRNIHKEKFWNHEIPQEKVLDARNTLEKKLCPTKYQARHGGMMSGDLRDPRLHATHEI